MTRYSHEPTANRCPPSCGTWPVALSRTRLRSGSSTFTRRPAAPRVSVEVARGVVAEEAQVQPAPPLERPVAAPGVAAEPAEQAGDVAVEIDAGQHRSVRQPHRLDLTAPRRPGPEQRQEPDRCRNDHSHRPAPGVSLRLQHEGHLLGLPLGE